MVDRGEFDLASSVEDALAATEVDIGRGGRGGSGTGAETFDWAALIPQYLALLREQQAIRLAVPATGMPVPDPRYMDPNQAFAAWPSATFHVSLRLRPDPAAAATDLRSLVRFTAPALPGELDEAGIAELIDELNRRGETTVRELLEVLEPTRLSAGQRVGLAVAV